MIKQLKNGIIQGIGIISVIGIFGITYAAVSQVSTGETLTAELFNQSMVPTGAVMAFNGSICPAGWNKADGSGDEKDTAGNLTTLDLRGEFIRGWDDGRGVDIGRILATNQIDEFKSHKHNITRIDGNWFMGSAAFAIPTGTVNASFMSYYDYNDKNRYFLDGDPDIFHASENGGLETRPRNVALLYCVKN